MFDCNGSFYLCREGSYFVNFVQFHEICKFLPVFFSLKKINRQFQMFVIILTFGQVFPYLRKFLNKIPIRKGQNIIDRGNTWSGTGCFSTRSVNWSCLFEAWILPIIKYMVIIKQTWWICSKFAVFYHWGLLKECKHERFLEMRQNFPRNALETEKK